jgi:hypothetical protein
VNRNSSSSRTRRCPTSCRWTTRRATTSARSSARIVDWGDFLEVQSGYAPNIVVGFARITGRTVGVVANQPLALSGVLDINASDKGSSVHPLLQRVQHPTPDAGGRPGFLPGVAQEHNGIIRHGAKMLYAYSAPSVPKVTVVLRKAYGGAYVAMCSKDLGADRVFAWPTAEIAVMGAEGAAEIVFRREIAEAPDPHAGDSSSSRSTAPRSRRRTSPSARDSSTTSSPPSAPARWCPAPWRCWCPSATCDQPRSTAWGPHERAHTGRRAGRCAGARGAGRCAGGRDRAVRADLPLPKEVPEEVVIAISAAVAAFLGHRARLTHVRYRNWGRCVDPARAGGRSGPTSCWG